MAACESVRVNSSCICNHSATLNECLWRPEKPYSVALVVIVTFFYIVIFVTAVVWNTFVIAIFFKDRHLFRTPFSLFLFLLAVVDLLEAILAIPFYITALIGGGWIIGNTDSVRDGTCVTLAFIFSMFLFTTVHLLAVISFDRFLYIVYPLKYRQWMTLPKAIILAVVASFIPIVLALLPFFGFGELGYSPFIAACLFRWEGERAYVITIAVEALIPIVATVVFTMWTYIYAKRFLRRRHFRQKSIDESTVRTQNAERTLTRTFALLLISQAICFAPGILTAFVGFFVGYINIPPSVLITDLLIIISSVAINPLIQSLSRTQIRHYLTPLLQCHRCTLVPTVREVEHSQQNGANIHTECTSNAVSIDHSDLCKAEQLQSGEVYNRTLKNYDIDPIKGTLV